MNKAAKASDYTHSVWSGRKYDKTQTTESLIAESRAVIARHPALGRLRAKPMTAEELRALCMTPHR